MWPSEWQLSYVALINAIYFVTSVTGCVCVKYLVSEVWKIVTSIYLSCSRCDMWQVSATLALFTLNCFLSAVCAQRRKEALYCQVRLFPAGHLEWKNAVLECCMENPASGGKREMVPVGVWNSAQEGGVAGWNYTKEGVEFVVGVSSGYFRMNLLQVEGEVSGSLCWKY